MFSSTLLPVNKDPIDKLEKKIEESISKPSCANLDKVILHRFVFERSVQRMHYMVYWNSRRDTIDYVYENLVHMRRYMMTNLTNQKTNNLLAKKKTTSCQAKTSMLLSKKYY